MGGIGLLMVRMALGAPIGAILGFIADGLARTQGYWLVGLMAGLIGGAISLYIRYGSTEEEKATPTEEE